MPVTINNYQTIAAGGTYTVPGTATDNRLLVVVVFSNNTNEERELRDCRFGGVTMTGLNAYNHDTQADMASRIYYLKESSIPSGAQAIDVDVIDFIPGPETTDTNAPRHALLAFTIYDFDQNAAPDLTTAVAERGSGDTGNVVLSLDYPANAGDYGVGICLASRDVNETHTISTDVGDLVGEADASGLNALFSSQSVFNRVVKIDSLIGTDTTNFTCDYTNSGTTSGSLRSVRAYGLSFIESGGSPTISITQSPIRPGGVISGSYSNFTPGTAPTSPLTLTDSNGNAFTVAVSIDDSAGDGTGTFTGTMPSLPSAGNTSNLGLFGNITVTLDDA